MARLRDRQRQIPNGFKYLEALTGWNSVKQIGSHPSFDRLVNELLTHRLGNPRYKDKWKTSRAGVEQDVEQYQVKICQSNGYWDFITDAEIAASPPPKVLPPSSLAGAAAGVIKKSAVPIRIVVDWIGNDLIPVDIKLAEQRAESCAACPFNDPDPNFLQRIGALAAKEVAHLIEVKHDLSLRTSLDDKIHTCSVCDCHLPLKIWVPLKHLKNYTSDDVRSRLWDHCWIKKELNG